MLKILSTQKYAYFYPNRNIFFIFPVYIERNWRLEVSHREKNNFSICFGIVVHIILILSDAWRLSRSQQRSSGFRRNDSRTGNLGQGRCGRRWLVTLTGLSLHGSSGHGIRAADGISWRQNSQKSRKSALFLQWKHRHRIQGLLSLKQQIRSDSGKACL